MRIRIALVVVAAMLGAGCGGDDARTFYESLDLETPEAAVATITQAFAQDDFMTVWLVLDTEAQFRFQQELSLQQHENVLAPAGVDALQASPESFYGMEQGDPWYFFDRVMLLADEADGFLIDLSEGFDIEEHVTSGDVATVTGRVGGIEEAVTFRLSRSDSGRWRVHQVAVPGGDPELIPWSAPNGAP
ncbi:MAG: hypothetical protein QNJ89_02680 [Acidimicrobiia bacterium]|nr:hypothetical protein [Acidimicrobiia bacterium]